MGTVVADVVARFRQEGLSDIGGTAEKTADSLDRLADSGGGVGSVMGGGGGGGGSGKAFDMDTSIAALGELESKSGSVGAAFKSMVVDVTGAAGVGAIINMAKNATVEVQNLGVQFNATFGSQGPAALEQSISLANKFGDTITSVATAYDTLGKVTGQSGSALSKDLKTMQDAAAGDPSIKGGSIDTISSSVANYYQEIQRQGAAGGAGARAANSLLSQNIIDPATYNQLRLAGNAGASPQQELQTVMADIEKQYAGAGKAGSKTLGGEIQTFKNQFTEGTRGGLSPLMKEFQTGLTDANKGMDSSGFKMAVKDIQELVSVVTGAIGMLKPFAAEFFSIAGAITSVVSGLSFLKPVLESVIAAWMLYKGINMATSLAQTVTGMGEEASAETKTAAATDVATASMEAQTVALRELIALTATMASVNGSTTLTAMNANLAASRPSVPEAVPSSPSMMERFKGTKLGGFVTSSTGLGIGGAIGASYAGSMIGGNTGTEISNIGSGAAVGTMIAPGVGTAIGAAAGLVVSAFQNASKAVSDYNTKVGSSTNTLEKNNPLGSTPQSITDALKQARADVSSANTTTGSFAPKPPSGLMGAVSDLGGSAIASAVLGPVISAFTGSVHAKDTAPTRTDQAAKDAASNELKSDRAAYNNMLSNIAHIKAQVPGISTSQAGSMANANSIDLTQTYASNKKSIETATGALNNLGGAAQATAEATSNKLGFIGSQASGQYGEQTMNLDALFKKAKTNYGQVTALSKQAGINPADYEITPQSASQTRMTAGQAQTLNANISAAQQLRDANNALTQSYQQLTQAQWGVQQANFAVGQAEFQAGQAAFSLGQAQFQAGQATFQLSQAEIQASQAGFQLGQSMIALGQAQFQASRSSFEYRLDLINQASAYSAVSTAINSGYLPANYNIASAIAQTTSLSQQQISTIMQEVDAYNSLEAQMNSATNSGLSLANTYTQLSGNVQLIQAEMQTYQTTLGQTLQGTLAYNQALQAETMASAQTSGAMAELQLAGYSTSSPEYINLQRQAQIQQAQSTITKSQNTTGLGNEQFQISQAQLPPTASFQAMLNAAKGIGALQPQLIAAQQTLNALAPIYDALNTKLQIQSSINQAVTSSVQTLGSGDRALITAQNAVFQAANGVVVAENSVVTASNAVVTANNWVMAAANGVTTAQNGVVTAQNNVAVSAMNLTQSEQQAWAASNQLTAAQWGVQDASDNAAQALNTFNGHLSANIQSWLSLIDGFITNVGVGMTNTLNAQQQAWNRNAQALSFGGTFSTTPFAGIFDDGGPIGGSGPQLAVVHGGEYVLRADQVNALKGGSGLLTSVPISPAGSSSGTGAANGSKGGNGSITIESGAISVHIDVSGSVLENDREFRTAVSDVINEALQQLTNSWNGR